MQIRQDDGYDSGTRKTTDEMPNSLLKTVDLSRLVGWRCEYVVIK